MCTCVHASVWNKKNPKQVTPWNFSCFSNLLWWRWKVGHRPENFEKGGAHTKSHLFVEWKTAATNLRVSTGLHHASSINSLQENDFENASEVLHKNCEVGGMVSPLQKCNVWSARKKQAFWYMFDNINVVNMTVQVTKENKKITYPDMCLMAPASD